MDDASTVSGDVLGYMLTKNKQYIGITFQEYMLRVLGARRCPNGVLDLLGAYKKVDMKYSSSELNRFYVGRIEVVNNEDDLIQTIAFDAVTGMNKSGWNFGSGENDYHVVITLNREDEVWTWRHGFAVVQYSECPNDCEDDVITIHQFIIMPKPPYGIEPTEEPRYYINKDTL